MRFALLAALFFAPLAGAEEPIRLFAADGAPVAGYDTLVAGLRTGDAVVFHDARGVARTYTLGPRLGAGGFEAIFAVSATRAIRVPQRADALCGVMNRAFQLGHRQLFDGGVPVPQMHFHIPRQVTEVDRVDVRFTLRSLLDGTALVDGRTRAEANEALFVFARSLAGFQSIGDFHPGQVAYVRGRGWMLLDWSESHAPWVPGAFQNPFWEDISNGTIPANLGVALNRAIAEERARPRTAGFIRDCINALLRLF